MAVTTRWSLPYQGPNDEPDGAALGEALATATDSALGRALAIANAAARPASPDRGLVVHQDDDDTFYGYTGALWVPLSGTAGGGGSVGGGRWTAGSTAQSIPATVSGEGTPVAFGSLGANVPSPTLVTRSSLDVGHQFELGAAGWWACGASVRVASSAATGEVSAAIWADLAGGESFTFAITAPDGGRREGLPRTLQPSRTVYLPAGTALCVKIYNGTGSTRTLEPSSGAWVTLDLGLVG